LHPLKIHDFPRRTTKADPDPRRRLTPIHETNTLVQDKLPDVPSRGLASTIGGDAIDPADLARMKAAFERSGGSILQDADIDAYLRYRAEQMGASNIGGITHNAKEMLLPTNATRTAVFEEFIHTAQFRSGRVNELIAKYGNAEAERLLEIEAAQKLVQNQRAWKLPQVEVDAVRRRLKQLEQGEH
jgi:hypothetical protein